MKQSHLKFAVVIIAVTLASGCLHSQLTNKSKTNEANEAKFSCENINEGIEKRGYVLLMGLADHNKQGWAVEKSYMEQDPKAQFVIIYDQDENLHLTQISEKFLADMHQFLEKNEVDELVIFGASAGGVTASYSISQLNFPGHVVLHTLSSPLKGYGFSGVKENFLGARAGFLRDIAIGLEPFSTPSENVKVYHHKTIRDTILVDYYCNGFTFLCNAVEIQNNNVEGGKEFFYQQYDHNPLMKVVISKVLKCYNENLEVASASEGNLGELCTGEEECNLFCHDNRGRCLQYCNTNTTNFICQKLLNQSESNESQEQTTPPSQIQQTTPDVVQVVQQSNATENISTSVDSLPVLKNLGVLFEPWDKNTNRAGAFIFKENEEKLFLEFGAEVRDAGGGMKILPTFEYRTAPDADVYSIADGTVTRVEYQEYFNDYEIILIPTGAPNWRIYQDHVKEVKVSTGQEIKAGQVLGKVGTANNNLGRTEISIGKDTANGPVGYCPFNYFDASLVSEYREKVSQFMRDWEEFKNNQSIYDEENHIARGCRYNALIEDGSTGRSKPYNES